MVLALPHEPATPYSLAMAPTRDSESNETPPRRFRLDDDSWDLLGECTAARRTNRSKWLTERVAWALRYDHAQPPEQFTKAEIAAAWQRVLANRAAEAERKRQAAESSDS